MLAVTPRAEVWGLSGGFSARLEHLGIRTALELAHAPRAAVRAACGVVVERTALELAGVSCLALEEVAPPRKNLCVSRCFGTATACPQELGEAVATHAARAGEKLRAQGRAASVLVVFAATDAHRPGRPQHFAQLARELDVPTSYTPTLVAAAGELARRLHRRGCHYKKAGVLALGLVDEGSQVQTHLWSQPDDDGRRRRLMAAVDRINREHGRHTVRPASCGEAGVGGPARAWHLRSDHRSGRYTTCWAELPVARAV